MSEEEYNEAPFLYWTSALTYLAQVIPDDLKSQSLQQVPFEARNFPLASTHASIQLRREAQELFSKFALAAKEIHCINAANIADDYALWLELRDPERSDSG